MNITEKLLAKAGGKPSVAPGDIVFANVDKVMIHDVSGPGVIKVFDKLKKEGIVSVEKLWNPSKVWVAEDHFCSVCRKNFRRKYHEIIKIYKAVWN